MGLFSKITNAVTGNLAGEIFDTVKAYFPPGMSEKEVGQMQFALQQLEDKRKAKAEKAESEAQQQFNDRVKELEGTAKDLKSIPYIGALIIFLRGCQRPAWGFLTMYLDVKWFSTWTLTEQQQTALILINFLVLGFLFGERTLKNLEPLLLKLLGNRQKE